MKIKFILLAGFFLGACTIPASAQLNLRVGYMASLFDAPITDAIVSNYNSSTAGLNSGLKSLRQMNGLVLGFRYKLDDAFGLELTYTSRSSKSRSQGKDPIDDSLYELSLFYRYQSISFGVEGYIGQVGIGVSIDYNIIDIQQKELDLSDRIDLVADNPWSNQIYVDYMLRGKGPLGIMIRPYVQIPWYKTIVRGLDDRINEGNPTDVAPYFEHLWNYGLSIVFYNGPKD